MIRRVSVELSDRDVLRPFDAPPEIDDAVGIKLIGFFVERHAELVGDLAFFPAVGPGSAFTKKLVVVQIMVAILNRNVWV